MVKISIFSVITLFFLILPIAYGHPPNIEWNKTFGGPYPDSGYSVQQTSDGGYIAAGSIATEFSNNANSDITKSDLLIIKTDLNGNQFWNKTFDGSDLDLAPSIQQTSDGGYIISSTELIYNSGVLGGTYLLKIDSNGNELWNRTYESFSIPVGAIQTSDKSYKIAGSSSVASFRFWLLNVDSNGTQQWSKTFDNGPDWVSSFQQTSDGGYVVSGRRRGSNSNFMIVKIDSNGDEQWNKTYGNDSNDDYNHYSIQTADGGYILAGNTQSVATRIPDALVIKIDSNGNQIWNKTFGGSGNDSVYSVQQTYDGGYLLAGTTSSFETSSSDLWLLKLDSDGVEQWSKTYGGSGFDLGISMQHTSDGGYIIAGNTSSFGNGYDDMWLVKLGPLNHSEINITSYFPSNLTPTIFESDNLGFNLTVSGSDENATVSWYQNDSLKSANSNFTFFGKDSNFGFYNITAIVIDRGYAINLNWNLTLDRRFGTTAKLINISDYGVDVDNNGIYDFLVVKVNFTLPSESNYDYSSQIISDGGSFYDCCYTSEFNKGYNTIYLNFSTIELFREGSNRSYRLFFYLRNSDSPPNPFINFSYNTSNYSYKQFENKPPFIKNLIVNKEYGYDDNADGLYDRLIFEIALNTTTSGLYKLKYVIFHQVFISYVDEIISYENIFNLTKGSNIINITLMGSDINSRRLDGNYILDSIYIKAPSYGAVDYLFNYLKDPYFTTSYNYTQFGFPNNFSTISSTIQTFLKNFKAFDIVVGDGGSAQDVIAASNIASGFQYNITGTCFGNDNCRIKPAKLSSEMTSALNGSFISIGNPYHNNITNSFLPLSTWPLKLNRAIIMQYPTGNSVKLIIAGNRDSDTRKASKVIANFGDYNLNSTCFEVDTSNPDNLIVYPCNLSKYPTDDVDDDGIIDTADYVIGTSSNINTNLGNISFSINDSENLSRRIDGKSLVKLMQNNKTFLEFYFDFSNSSLLDLSNFKFLNASNSTTGAVIISGINLSNGLTKTAYVEKINNGINGLCIKDEDITSITELTSNCDAQNEYKVECDGSKQNAYTCTYNSSSNLYRVTGLSHSGIMQLSYTQPSSISSSSASSSSSGGGSSGGGGGGGGGSIGFVCNMDWKCNEWSSCKNNFQSRECNFVKVSQHIQETECPTLSNAPVSTQKCETNKEVYPEQQSKISEAKEKEAKPEEKEISKSTNSSSSKNKSANSITAGAVTNLLSNPKTLLGFKIGAIILVLSSLVIMGYKSIYKRN